MGKHGIRLTSLIVVEERLREASYFARALGRQRNADVISYQLNAFLSASRSVTFLLQKEMSRVRGFESWWGEQQQELSRDKAARFFLKLRNFSQKEGRVSLVGTRVPKLGGSRWIFRFGGNSDKVPPELVHRNVDDCCIEHVAKLAGLILKCCERFPYHVSARRALTPDGVQELELSMHDICEAAGLPKEWGDASSELPREEVLRIVRESVDDLDFRFLRRLAKGRPKTRTADALQGELGEDLLLRMVTQLEGPEQTLNMAEVLGELLLVTRPAHEEK
ncbi:hypothetical protein [Ralstonia solanacearum]|uniref:hypothetical protein n=1 Tax=Ralstonia solanacearum TaxID=305 RepID=UPI0006DC4F74|nr:hypothetical protein [Ralstonia solanacearum]